MGPVVQGFRAVPVGASVGVPAQRGGKWWVLGLGLGEGACWCYGGGITSSSYVAVRGTGWLAVRGLLWLCVLRVVASLKAWLGVSWLRVAGY